MSNANTGLWSALAAIAGGAAGAAAGKYVAATRPRTYNQNRGDTVEDAMVVGGATGAVLGAFIGATLAGEEAPAVAVTLPQTASR